MQHCLGSRYIFTLAAGAAKAVVLHVFLAARNGLSKRMAIYTFVQPGGKWMQKFKGALRDSAKMIGPEQCLQTVMRPRALVDCPARAL